MQARRRFDGALFGAGAYVVGFVLTILATEVELTDDLLFYGLFEFEGYLLTQIDSHELRLVTEGELITGLLPMTVVSILLLVGAGFAVASQAGGRRSTGGPKHGATITVGYFAMATVATLILVLRTDGPLDTTSVLVTLVVTGVVYPIAFGGLGGLIAENQ